MRHLDGLLLSAALVACSAEPPSQTTTSTDAPATAGGKGDQWDYAGSPERFKIALERRLDALPKTGRADQTPWAETYWPVFEDSFNARWQGPGTLSPLEKYDQAFNGWTPPAGFSALRPLTAENCASGAWDRAYYTSLGPAARYWSDNKGIGQLRNGKDDDGDGRVDECDDLDGIEDWWGSCHAWTPAAILEPEPLEPVTLNGVRFEVSDIKALVISLYDQASQLSVGERCNQSNPARDATGRVIDPDCRNTNAGTFHLLATNLLGVQHRAFAEDRIADSQVWNQPVTGYRVLDQRELTLADALRLLKIPGPAYPYNPAAKRFVEVRTDVDYIVESAPSTRPTSPNIADFVKTDRYHYVLELDAAGTILGGEWAPGPASHADRPDFLWLPLGPGRTTNPNVSADKVRELLRLSRPDTRSTVVKTYVDAPGVLIDDYPKPGPKRTITIPDALTAREVKVRVEISHGWIYDVQVRLTRGSQTFLLFDQRPEGSSSTELNATYTIRELAGQSIQGDWTLEVTDRSSRATGRLMRWSVDATIAP